MLTITILSRGKQFDVTVDGVQITDVLNLLESAEAVEAYKITVPSIGVLNDDQLEYSYSGYLSPAGKAVERFFV